MGLLLAFGEWVGLEPSLVLRCFLMADEEMTSIMGRVASELSVSLSVSESNSLVRNFLPISIYIIHT